MVVSLHAKEAHFYHQQDQIQILEENTHKYGIQVPDNLKKAKAIDQENGNNLWGEAMVMEMTNNWVGFDNYEGNTSDLVAYEEITGHFIFDLKLSENFRRKAGFVADGHLVETPVSITYSTVVPRESTRTLLLVAALNNIKIMGAYVHNAFLSADNI